MKGPYQATLLGMVEVKASLSNLNKEARLDVGRACHSLVVGCEPVSVPASNYLLGSVHPLYKRVLICIRTESMQVLCGEELVTEHKLSSVSTLVAMTQQHKGQLVFIGQCSKAKKRLGVVLDLYSEAKVNTFVLAYREGKEDGNTNPARLSRAESQRMPASLEKTTPVPTSARALPPTPTQDLPSPPVSNEPRPVTPAQISDRPLPPLPPGNSPQLPPKPANNAPTPPAEDRPLPPAPREQQHPQPTTSEQIYSLSDSSMSQRPLPPLPKESSPSKDSPYQEIPMYENERKDSGAPQLPLRYANLEEIAREKLLLEPNYDVEDWSGHEEQLYQNIDNYYLTLGIDQEEAEKLYMTTFELDEVEGEEELVRETTLEEDIQAFIKDEFNFKNVIWRIREAKPMLAPGLQHFLKGTETLADIHNDMYIELYDGYKSCSKIAEVFLSRTDQLERYKYYLLNSPKIQNLIHKEPENVKKMFPKLNQDIQSSWKRLQFYQSSLEKMMAVAPLNERPALDNVVTLLRDLNRQGDSGIIMEGVKGAPFSIYEYAPLLLHSSFLVRNVALKDMKSPCHLMLFPKVLIITEPKDDGYQFLFRLYLQSLQLLPSKHDKESSFVLKTKNGVTFGVKATSEEKMQVWKERIKGLIVS